MDNRNKFWKGVMVGVLVTAFTCFVTVGASTAIYMFGQGQSGGRRARERGSRQKCVPGGRRKRGARLGAHQREAFADRGSG